MLGIKKESCTSIAQSEECVKIRELMSRSKLDVNATNPSYYLLEAPGWVISAQLIK